MIEPLSLDEAYLDVTENKTGLATATKVASAIRQQIREELNLTASAGVAPNKFLAKIASDWRKPNGLFVIQPAEVEEFLTPLPVGRIPGVGKVTEEKLAALGLRLVGELRARSLEELETRFGRYGQRLYELARGIDENPVVPNRPTQSISAEDTFEQDVLLAETEPMIRRLAEKTWEASRKESRIARTVVLKLKTAQFQVLTRSQTPIVAARLLRRTDADRSVIAGQSEPSMPSRSFDWWVSASATSVIREGTRRVRSLRDFLHTTDPTESILSLRDFSFSESERVNQAASSNSSASPASSSSTDSARISSSSSDSVAVSPAAQAHRRGSPSSKVPP